MRLPVLAVVILSPLSTATAQTVPEAPRASPDSGSDRICQDVKLTGSRLTVKRFCGTRDQWAEASTGPAGGRADPAEPMRARRLDLQVGRRPPPIPPLP